MLLIMFWLMMGVVCALICASMASTRKRPAGLWAFMGFLFGFFAILVLAAIGTDHVTEQQEAIRAATPPAERKCPVCAETIKAEAIKCRFCGASVEPLPIPPAPVEGKCPSCDAIIPYSSESCPKCSATFGEGAAWKVIPIKPS